MEILKRVLKDVLYAILVLVVIAAILILLDRIGLPGWPFLFLLFYFTVVAGSRSRRFCRRPSVA